MLTSMSKVICAIVNKTGDKHFALFFLKKEKFRLEAEFAKTLYKIYICVGCLVFCQCWHIHHVLGCADIFTGALFLNSQCGVYCSMVHVLGNVFLEILTTTLENYLDLVMLSALYKFIIS